MGEGVLYGRRRSLWEKALSMGEGALSAICAQEGELECGAHIKAMKPRELFSSRSKSQGGGGVAPR